MKIRVELFGIPRERAGVAETEVNAVSLGEALTELARQFPALAESCIDDQQLRPGFVANLGGDRFVADPATRLDANTALLILSADAGG